MNKDYSIERKVNSNYRKKIFLKISKIVLLSLILIISLTYLFLYLLYQRGNFIISLDKNMSNRKNVYLSESATLTKKETKLSVETLDYMDNISINWISENVDTEKDGEHNGTNYIAYTFYVSNLGKETVNYWYEIDIDDTIRNVDKAIRIMIYRNGVPIVYAKENETTKKAEENTKKFRSDDIAVLEERKNFAPNDKDKFTLVIWIEGDDPDCLDDLIGGELKMHMDITEEHVQKKK